MGEIKITHWDFREFCDGVNFPITEMARTSPHCNGRGRAQVIWMLQDWTRSAYRETKIGICFKVVLLLCYTRERVKREEKEILQHQTTSLYIQSVRYLRIILHASMYQPNNRLMILHTWKLFLSVQPRHIVRPRNTSSYVLIVSH